MDNVKFNLAQCACEPGGWAALIIPTVEEIEEAERRWALRSYRHGVVEDGWIPNQCGGCRFFAATGSDFGICWNEKSPLDGCITFEHGGCTEHSEIEKNQV